MGRPRPTRTRTAAGSRRGSVALETLLVLPLLLVVLWGLVEFALLLGAEQKLAEASGVGCRTGSLGHSDQAVKDAVKTVLGHKQYEKAKVHTKRWHDKKAGGMIEVTVDLPATAASPSLLRLIGLNLNGETLTGRSVMRIE